MSEVGRMRTLAASVVIAACAQVISSIRLAEADVHALARFAHVPQPEYVWAAVGVLAVLAAAWFQRGRPLLAAFIVLAGQVGVWIPASRATTALGWDAHLELIAHHYVGVAAPICIAIAAPLLGAARLRAALRLAALALFAAHMVHWRNSEASIEWAGFVAAAGVLGVAIHGFVRAPDLRTCALWLALPAPLLVRIGAAGWAGFAGAPVPDAARPWLLGALVLSAVVVFTSLRPRVDPWSRIFAIAVAAVTTALGYWFYRAQFGAIEPNLDDLIRSFWGFGLPYPKYVSRQVGVLVSTALFLMLLTTYTCTLSDDDRTAGLGLACFFVAGIGLTSPGLAGMILAAHVLVGASLAGASGPSTPQASRVDGAALVEALRREFNAELLHVPLSRGERWRLEGSTSDRNFRLELERRKLVTLSLLVGVVGKSRPRLVLTPQRRGQAIADGPLAATHRVVGDARELETIDAQVPEQLARYPQATLRMWDTGAEIEFGHALAELDATSIATLIRGLAQL